MKTINSIHTDLNYIIQNIYAPLQYKYSPPIPEDESSEYAACTFELNGRALKFRQAKITPTKVGQFVTLWRRNENGITQPHEISDAIDLVIISTRNKNHFGQFIFPKSVLVEQGIISTSNKEGKRGFRVYPPWDLTDNKQAQKTQKWQLNYFLEINNELDLELARKLYSAE